MSGGDVSETRRPKFGGMEPPSALAIADCGLQIFPDREFCHGIGDIFSHADPVGDKSG
jgi:hypothetical protein